MGGGGGDKDEVDERWKERFGFGRDRAKNHRLPQFMTYYSRVSSYSKFPKPIFASLFCQKVV
jgi:hypothetical protein